MQQLCFEARKILDLDPKRQQNQLFVPRKYVYIREYLFRTFSQQLESLHENNVPVHMNTPYRSWFSGLAPGFRSVASFIPC